MFIDHRLDNNLLRNGGLEVSLVLARHRGINAAKLATQGYMKVTAIPFLDLITRPH